ncbi:MAG: cupin domain-containing protein [Actinomycetota bacterium]|nr:cupin domain-containing protein [Actinomycetota bacterium]
MTKEPSFTVLENLLDEVEIPENGTLSRVVFNADGLRVVLFAFDTGEQLTDHAATVPAVVQVVKGRLEMTLGDQKMEIDPGSWVHMDAHLVHALVALEPSVVILTLQRNT